MKTRQRDLAAAATLLAAALSLTACDSHPAPNDKIPGAGKHKSASPKSPSPKAGDEADRPNMTFPKDVKIVFEDWKTSKGPKRQAALDNAANFIRSIAHGVVEQNLHDPAYLHYSSPTGQAQSYAKDYIQQNIKDHWSLTGTDLYSDPDVRMAENNKRAAVSFCEDQSQLFSKDLDTGKPLPTGEDVDNILRYEVAMEPVSSVDGLWWATSISIEDGGKSCAS